MVSSAGISPQSTAQPAEDTSLGIFLNQVRLRKTSTTTVIRLIGQPNRRIRVKLDSSPITGDIVTVDTRRCTFREGDAGLTVAENIIVK